MALVLSSVRAAVAATLETSSFVGPACDNALVATDFAAALAPEVLSTCDDFVARLGEVFRSWIYFSPLKLLGKMSSDEILVKA